jgi:hypothetical protein
MPKKPRGDPHHRNAPLQVTALGRKPRYFFLRATFFLPAFFLPFFLAMALSPFKRTNPV